MRGKPIHFDDSTEPRFRAGARARRLLRSISGFGFKSGERHRHRPRQLSRSLPKLGLLLQSGQSLRSVAPVGLYDRHGVLRVRVTPTTVFRIDTAGRRPGEALGVGLNHVNVRYGPTLRGWPGSTPALRPTRRGSRARGAGPAWRDAGGCASQPRRCRGRSRPPGP